MTAYLIEHPPRQRQFKRRGTTISGVIVIHTAESAPDTTGMDLGAEGVARFIQGRTTYGSYHWVADSDSLVDLIPMRNYQAYGDSTGSNPHAIHISAATQAHHWKGLPKDWVEGTVENMALAAHKASDLLKEVHGVRIPAKRRIKAETDRRMEGFISHGERDPGRRSDPGADFPWDMFFRFYEALESPKPPAPTRGRQVDLALERISAAITALDKAKGRGERLEDLEEAEKELRQARRAIRGVGIINRDRD